MVLALVSVGADVGGTTKTVEVGHDLMGQNIWLGALLHRRVAGRSPGGIEQWSTPAHRHPSGYCRGPRGCQSVPPAEGTPPVCDVDGASVWPSTAAGSDRDSALLPAACDAVSVPWASV